MLPQLSAEQLIAVAMLCRPAVDTPLYPAHSDRLDVSF